MQKHVLYGSFAIISRSQTLSPMYFGLAPSSISSYSNLKPEMVEEAEVHDTTKLLEVISVMDSDMSTTGGGGVVSPSHVSTFLGKLDKRK